MSSLKSLLPGHVRRAVVASRTALHEKAYWQGVYTSFADVPKAGDGFDGDSWAEETARGIKLLSEQLGDSPLTTTRRFFHHELLALYIASAFAPDQCVKLLDFGGGMAPDYFHLAQALNNPSRVEYIVLEAKKLIDRALSDSAPVKFPDQVKWISDLAEISGELDIIHLNAVLQYIEDWKGLLGVLADFRPKAFLGVRLPIGDFPTYATGQCNHAPSVIPCWFFNQAELVESFEQFGYSLKFHGMLDRVYNHTNVPEEYQCPKRAVMLFVRDTDQ